MKKDINLSDILIRLLLVLTTPVAALTPAEAQNMSEDMNQDLRPYTFNVGNFHTICVQDNVNVVYNCSKDTLGTVSYHSIEDFGNAFIFTNNNGTLKIQVTTEDVGKEGLPTLYLSSPKLDRVENYSDYNLRVETNLPRQSFSASLVGNGSILINDLNAHETEASITAGMGTIILTGKCASAIYKLAGTGTIQADRLKADNVQCKILGGGSITTYPLLNLKTKGIGSTKIYYRGRPKIKRVGGGKLIPID